MDVPVPPVDAIEASQLQVCAISKREEEYSDLDSGYEEFLTKTHELEMWLSECAGIAWSVFAK